jgi:hypothetical protein
MVVAGVWLLSAPASAAYVPAAVMCAPGVTRETDAVLPMHLDNQTRLRPQDLEVIAGIADAVWRRYQVRVVLAGFAAAALRVTVVDKSSPQAGTQGPIPVASIVFDQGHATPTIYLWLGSAERLAASRPGERNFSDLPTNRQNLLVSRILGASLAHEIGHYLLDSAAHSTRGLLRATIPTLEMLDPRLQDLGLDDQQIASLCEKAAGAQERRPATRR